MDCTCASSDNETLVISLQACNPSTHVWSNFESPSLPQFLNQAPPGAQQLSFPDFLMAPHLKHMGPIAVTVVVVTAAVDVCAVGQAGATFKHP